MIFRLMTRTEHWQIMMAQRVASICEEQGVTEVQCESLVKDWLADIQPCHRPEVAGVLMDAKRLIWGLEPIH